MRDYKNKRMLVDRERLQVTLYKSGVIKASFYVKAFGRSVNLIVR